MHKKEKVLLKLIDIKNQGLQTEKVLSYYPEKCRKVIYKI